MYLSIDIINVSAAASVHQLWPQKAVF